MNKKRAIYLTVPFLSIIFGVGMLNFVTKDKKVSEAENRNLQQKPTLQNLKDKNFTTTYETYYTDQFILRDKLLKLDTQIQLASKKSNVKGHYITDDKWILGGTATTKKTKKDYNTSINKLNEIANKVKKSNKEMYYVSLPHKVNTLSYKYPKYIDKSYGMENSDLFLSMIDKNNTKIIDVGRYFVDNFSKKELESFYFKTDHHWNSIGAYEAFKYIIEELNKYDNLNIDLSKYNYKTSYLSNKPFIGSYNRNLYTLFDTNEPIPYVYMDRKYNNKYYEIKDGKFEEVKENYIIGDRFNEDDMTYGGAYTGNHPYYKVINDKAITNKKVMIIRDSYQAPLTWLLSDVFTQVEIVDPRHVNMDIDEILKKSDSDIVMVMFNNGADVESMLDYIEK